MPNSIDKSVLLRLTPCEVMTLLKDFAERYHQSVNEGEHYSVEELAKAFYEFHVGTLPEVMCDEDILIVPRLEFNN